MNASEIRQKYLKFFEARGHTIIPRARLVPDNDPSTLFTGSGMQPLVPYLLGEVHPEGGRLVDSQTCFRAEDVDEVGDNRHTTFFEMLGNWSLGEYFKESQIPYFWEFLVDEVGLDPHKLYVTCYSGQEEYSIPKDTESAEIWKGLFKTKGIDAETGDMDSEEGGYKRGMKPGERIFFYQDKNWWTRSGTPDKMPAGEPGGPSSEVFYEYDHIEHDTSYGEHCHPNCDCGRFLEIGNSVFMAYKKNAQGGFDELKNKNVDFGGGLERIAAASLGTDDIFRISLLYPVIEELQKVSGKSYEDNVLAMRVIADHLRAAVFLVNDGVLPSNKEQGYVLRRFLRRAIRRALELGIEQDLAATVVPVVVQSYQDAYPELANMADTIQSAITNEEKVFRSTLTRGLREFDKLTGRIPATIPMAAGGGTLTGEVVFKLSDTYGFPVELSLEEAERKNIAISPDLESDYDVLLQEQRERSRTATKGQFKGGLADHSEITTKYHTATHMMYRALRTVLGDHVEQRGSNITAERLRFDFNNPEKVTREQLDEVEKIVNDAINEDIPVAWRELPLTEAMELGARGHFGEKYGEIVKMYTIGHEENPYSRELCGGPHVEHTGALGEGGKTFKILKEESSSAGIRRIKAALV